MHGLGHIEISNFRVCRNVSLPLGAFTPLVGQNNCGKSTILEAIKLVLSPRSLSPTDASDQAQPISVCARIDGIDDALLSSLPDPRHRAAIEPFCRAGTLWIRVVGPGKCRQEVWDPEQYAGTGTPTEWRSYPTGIAAAVSALLPEARHIEAMDDVQEDLSKGKAGSTIRGLLDDIMAPVLQAHAQFSEALDSIRALLSAGGASRSPLLDSFDREATTALGDFLPGLAVDMDMPSVDIKEFFKSGDLHVTDVASSERRRFDQLGTGTQRALQMALVRLLADRQRRSTGALARRVLLIDEPELFLHPQAVARLREALRSLSTNGYQVVFATHSPMMLSRDNAPDTVIVRRTADEGAVVKPPLRHAVMKALDDAPAQARTLFDLANVAEIYFCQKVILCEGQTERRLLPLLFRSMGTALEASLCIVSLGSCSSIRKGMLVLGAMGVDCAAIADLDFGFTHARSGNQALLPSEDDQMVGAKAVLRRLRDQRGCSLGPNDLPQNSSQWPAWLTWSEFARDTEGGAIAQRVHAALVPRGVWLWPVGCIEDVLGVQEKGEEIVMQQEERLRGMAPADLIQQLPGMQACLEWLCPLPPVANEEAA